MASPQTEDGFTRFANELLEAILRHPFSKQELKMVLAVARKTYGFNKLEDDLSNSQLAEMTGIGRSHCSEAVKRLIAAKVFLFRDGRHGKLLKLNKNYKQWGVPETGTPPRCSRNGTLVFPKRDAGVPETGHTKDNPKRQPQKTEGARATRAPSALPLTPGLIDFATQQGLPLGDWLQAETERFLDYHRAKGSKFRSWDAAWRNWMRKAVEFGSAPKEDSDARAGF